MICFLVIFLAGCILWGSILSGMFIPPDREHVRLFCTTYTNKGVEFAVKPNAIRGCDYRTCGSMGFPRADVAEIAGDFSWVTMIGHLVSFAGGKGTESASTVASRISPVPTAALPFTVNPAAANAEEHAKKPRKFRIAIPPTNPLYTLALHFAICYYGSGGS